MGGSHDVVDGGGRVGVGGGVTGVVVVRQLQALEAREGLQVAAALGTEDVLFEELVNTVRIELEDHKAYGVARYLLQNAVSVSLWYRITARKQLSRLQVVATTMVAVRTTDAT